MTPYDRGRVQAWLYAPGPRRTALDGSPAAGTSFRLRETLAEGAIISQATMRAAVLVAVGGIGQNIVQMAQAFGAVQLIAVGRGQNKLDIARRMGATDTVDSRATDPVLP